MARGGKRPGAGRPTAVKVVNPAVQYALAVLADLAAPADRRDAMAVALLQLGPVIDAKLFPAASK